MLPAWTERPEVTANLLNPAFCTEIIREVIKGYGSETDDEFPFALSVLILPFILNNRIRNRLPGRKGTPLHSWINENEDLKIGLGKQISSFLPFTQDAIIFALSHHALRIDNDGHLLATDRKGSVKTGDDEVNSCLKKAAAFGKNLARSGTMITVFSVLGIKP